MLRYLLTGKFDKTAFGAFLLDLFRKNIIDIQKNGDSILLVKRTDNIRSLPRKEQAAVKSLFGTDAVMTVNSSTLPRFKKAMESAAEEVYTKFRIFSLKLNGGYLFFSCGMLLLAQAFTAYLVPDGWAVFSGLFFVDLNIAAYLLLFNLNWKKKSRTPGSQGRDRIADCPEFCDAQRLKLDVGSIVLFGLLPDNHDFYQALHPAQRFGQG